MHQLEIKKVSYLVLFSQIYNSEMYALLLNRLISNHKRFVSFPSAIKTLMLSVIKKKLGDTSLLYDERYLFEYQQNFRERREGLAFLFEIFNFE